VCVCVCVCVCVVCVFVCVSCARKVGLDLGFNQPLIHDLGHVCLYIHTKDTEDEKNIGENSVTGIEIYIYTYECICTTYNYVYTYTYKTQGQEEHKRSH